MPRPETLQKLALENENDAQACQGLLTTCYVLNSYDSLHVLLLTSAYECYRGNLASAHRSIVTAPYDAQVYRYATSLLECQLARCGLAIKHAPWPRAPGAAGLPAGARPGLSGAVVGARVSLPSTAANAAAMGLLDG